MSNSEKQPDVVLITSHDLGQHLGCYGVEAVDTPNLDGLAESGVRFENAVATTPVCSPARGSLLTGRYPQSNGLLGLKHAPWWWEIEAGEPVLPELLAEAGYETHLSGLQHVAPDAERLGFDHRHNPDRVAKRNAAVADEIFAGAGDDQPIYAQFGFSETHRSFDHDPYDEDGIYVPDYLQPTEAIRDDLARFQADVNYLDSQVGAVLDAIDDHGALDDAIVVFAADHGIPYPGAKWWCRDPGVEISLLIDSPDAAFESDAAEEAVISNVDVLPTLFDALGVSVPDRVEGVSFYDYLASETSDPPRNAAFTQYTATGNEARGIVTEDHTLIRNFGAGRTIDYPVDADPTIRSPSQPPGSEPRPYVQLYERNSDPANLEDIAEDRPDVVADLSDRVRGWMARVDDPLLRGGIRYPYHRRSLRDMYGTDE